MKNLLLFEVFDEVDEIVSHIHKALVV